MATKTQIKDLLLLSEELEELLLDSGFDAVFEEVEKSVDRMFEASKKNLAVALTIKPQKETKAQIKAVKKFIKDDFVSMTDRRLARPMKQALLEAISRRGLSQEDMRARISKAIDDASILSKSGKTLTSTQVDTLVSDSLRRVGRSAKVITGEEAGLEIVAYQGPLDKITSPQCEYLLTQGRHGVPNMWLVNEVKAGMHPGLKEDPLTAGGHYNCRHSFSPVSLRYAKTKGWKDGK